MTTSASRPSSHPFYLVPLNGVWRVFRYSGNRDLGHADYWRQNVALVVAKYLRLPFSALRELPYCLPRGRYVARCELPAHEGREVLFFGESLTREQSEAVRAAYGDLPILPDEHEVRLPADVEVLDTLLRARPNQN